MVTFLCKVLPAVKEQIISMCTKYGVMGMVTTPEKVFIPSPSLPFVCVCFLFQIYLILMHHVCSYFFLNANCS